MCTVTFLPKGNDEFVLTSNRDEAPSRSPKEVSRLNSSNGLSLIFPRDTKAGGTWIAASSDNRVVCVLNGAFEKHKHQPPYRLSRGLMVLQFFEYPTAQAFFHEFDLEGIEPFTFIIYDKGSLFEFRWDGQIPYTKPLSVDKPHIWSSSTLYPPEIRDKRQEVFQHWLAKEPTLSTENILNLHRTGSVGDPRFDYVMNRENIVRTVSITSVQKNVNSARMDYFDLLSENQEKAFHQSLALLSGI